MTNPMDALIDAHQKHGLQPISDMPGKRWIGTCGPWKWIVNGGDTYESKEDGIGVPPFRTYVWYNGWIAGILDPVGRGEFAAGTGANADTFAKALETWKP